MAYRVAEAREPLFWSVMQCFLMDAQDESVLDDDELISERQKILKKKGLLEFYLSHKCTLP